MCDRPSGPSGPVGPSGPSITSAPYCKPRGANTIVFKDPVSFPTSAHGLKQGVDVWGMTRDLVGCGTVYTHGGMLVTPAIYREPFLSQSCVDKDTNWERGYSGSNTSTPNQRNPLSPDREVLKQFDAWLPLHRKALKESGAIPLGGGSVEIRSLEQVIKYGFPIANSPYALKR